MDKCSVCIASIEQNERNGTFMELINENRLWQLIERFKTAADLIEDYEDYLECQRLISDFDRAQALCHFQKMIHRYESQINQLGLFEGNIQVIHGVSSDDKDDCYIMSRLSFVGQRIPIYVSIREGEKELLKELEKRISRYGFNAFN